MNNETAIDALKALAHAHRLTAFRALIEAGPAGLTVGELRERLEIPAATLTAHLNVLRNAKLVIDQRDGRSIHCKANFQQMNELLNYLTQNCCQNQTITSFNFNSLCE